MIFIRGARQLLTLRGPTPPRRGIQLADLSIIRDGALLIDGEKVLQVGPTRRIENLAAVRSAQVIDATGKVIVPGFVDSHTRLTLTDQPLLQWTAQFEEQAGPSGLPPSPARSSARALREQTRRWTCLFAAHGTTALEMRLATGLGEPSEMKALQAARELDGKPLDVTSTFLASRREFETFRRGGTNSEEIAIMLRVLARRRLVFGCDVECGPGAFDLAQGRRILAAAKELRLAVRVQADLESHSGATRLAVEMQALSAEQLLFTTAEEIGLLAGSTTLATLLPAVALARGGKRYPPARQLVDRGAAVVLASGFGPSSPTLSMPMVLALACREMKLSPAEAVVAATINGAAAIGRADRLGSLEPGKQADLALFDVNDYREIPYYFGFNLCVMTMKKGRVIHETAAAPVT